MHTQTHILRTIEAKPYDMNSAKNEQMTLDIKEKKSPELIGSVLRVNTAVIV